MRWGYDEDKITTVDWDDEVIIDGNLKIYALETRHFSGREFSNRNQSLLNSARTLVTLALVGC